MKNIEIKKLEKIIEDLKEDIADLNNKLEDQKDDIYSDVVCELDKLIDEYQQEINMSEKFDVNVSAQKVIETLRYYKKQFII